jgi:hypothetical protein
MNFKVRDQKLTCIFDIKGICCRKITLPMKCFITLEFWNIRDSILTKMTKPSARQMDFAAEMLECV